MRHRGKYYNVITLSHQLSTTAETLMITVVGDCLKGLPFLDTQKFDQKGPLDSISHYFIT